MSKILIVANPAGGLFGKYIGGKEEHHREWADLRRISDNFIKYGYEVQVTDTSKINLKENYSGCYVVYASSEDRGGFYKEYIEDILMRLEIDGAVLIPSLPFFRAHHNKGFQEMMRMQFRGEGLRYPESIVVDDYSSVKGYAGKLSYPMILKMARGSGSAGVVKIEDERQLLIHAKDMMRAHYYDYLDPKGFIVRNAGIVWVCKEALKKLLGRQATVKQSSAIECNTLVMQEYIRGLAGDYKVLFFAGHYYVLYRENRDKDFRASGSGKFVFPKSADEISDILDFAETAAGEIKMPCISMDIARTEDRCALIEFQCVFFGNYTMQYSDYYYVRENEEWKQCKASYELEDEYCRAIHQHILDNKDI